MIEPIWSKAPRIEDDELREEIERLRGQVGVGLCPECGEPAVRDNGPAEGGAIGLWCQNDHRWTAVID
jgi:hypothetical protein